MKATPESYFCNECGEVFPKWLGRCPSCGAWNSFQKIPAADRASVATPNAGGHDLLDSAATANELPDVTPLPTRIPECDRVLGGGFVPGGSILFGGQPGIGKSTLALQIFLQYAGAVYFTGEESAAQVLQRAKRISGKELPAGSHIISTTVVEDIARTITTHKPALAVVDSIQMVGPGGMAGSLGSIREGAFALCAAARAAGTALLIIGHVTKTDELAGPKILEHMVDTVLYLEGDPQSEVRILRATKNRFGSTAEIGVFAMNEDGLQEQSSAENLFLAHQLPDAIGSAITITCEGSRSFLLEVQALTVKTNFGQPRRTAQGFALSRMHVLLAVISKYTSFSCETVDAYLNVVGGMSIREPAADLAVCMAMLSSLAQKPLPAQSIFLGEVGLSGEIRPVVRMGARMHEAIKMGYSTIYAPEGKKGEKLPTGGQHIPCRSIQELVSKVFAGNL